MCKSGLASLAFYYFDFSDVKKQHRRGLLFSLLCQLCDQSDPYCNALSRPYSIFKDGGDDLDDSLLTRFLKDMLRSSGQPPIYLILDGLDALDECRNPPDTPSPQENVLMLLEELVNLRLPNLCICVTSNLEVNIKTVLDRLDFRSISLPDEDGHMEDIRDYVTSVVRSDPQAQRWRAEDKDLVIDVLSQKANGM
jgi:hypothetical protein